MRCGMAWARPGTILATLLALGVGGLAVRCGPPPLPAIVPGPAIAGLNVTGKWYSTQYGDMELVQTGDRVTGRYRHPRGPAHDGTMRGEITGDVLRIQWIQPGDSGQGVFPIRGRAWFRISQDAKKLAGQWGYNDDERAGGPWTAEKSIYQ